MHETEELKIDELQRRVTWLTRVVVLLTALLALNYAVPMVMGALLGLLLLIITMPVWLLVLAFTHHWIPPLARELGKLISLFMPRSSVR